MNGKCLPDFLTRGLFGGRIAVWGAAAPLAVIIAATCAVFMSAEADAAVALGATATGLYAWRLGGVILAVAVHMIVSGIPVHGGSRKSR